MASRLHSTRLEWGCRHFPFREEPSAIQQLSSDEAQKQLRGLIADAVNGETIEPLNAAEQRVRALSRLLRRDSSGMRSSLAH